MKMYAGDELPPEQIATIHCATGFQTYAFDGKRVKKGEVGSHFEVLPGDHTLRAGLYVRRNGEVIGGPPKEVSFNVEAGHEYYCFADLDQVADKWSLAIVPAEEYRATPGSKAVFWGLHLERAKDGSCFDYFQMTERCPDL